MFCCGGGCGPTQPLPKEREGKGTYPIRALFSVEQHLDKLASPCTDRKNGAGNATVGMASWLFLRPLVVMFTQVVVVAENEQLVGGMGGGGGRI